MAEWKCPTCLRALHRFGDAFECSRCATIRHKTDLTPKDINFLLKAITRQLKATLGYWPPRWARE